MSKKFPVLAKHELLSRQNIEVINTRVHNLKNLSVSIPRNELVVFTGVSGSGKSSLVYDTIYAESQRQLLETFSSFAQSRMAKSARPDADAVLNISTPIIINQKPLGNNPRSTVGTVTDIYSYIRLLYSRFDDERNFYPASFFSFNDAAGMCPQCKGLGVESVPDVQRIVDFNLSVHEGAIRHPMYGVGKWYWKSLINCGFFDPHKPVKRFTEKELHMLLHCEETTFTSERMGERYESKYAGILTRLKERHDKGSTSPSAYGEYIVQRVCEGCNGSRLNAKARSITLFGMPLEELVDLEVSALYDFILSVDIEEARPLTSKIAGALQNLRDIGSGYLTLNRSVATLSGGESQRVKMARQLDCDLINMIYILDEPTSGLHPGDVDAVIAMLRSIRDRQNTVLVVEHDPEVILSADSVVEIGPGAGSKGGELIFAGAVDDFRKRACGLMGDVQQATKLREKRLPGGSPFRIENADTHNLKNITVEVPRGVLVAITGPAGSGKSSLVHHHFMVATPDAICIDQRSPFRTRRSSVLSFVKIFDAVRQEFAAATGADPSLFSFNSKGGCPECNGQGEVKVDMSFMEEMRVVCKACNGKRYIDSVLELEYKKKNIYDVLCMTVFEARNYFEDPVILKGLDMLISVGLDYVALGQSLSTLSGGELQRLKLAKELKHQGRVYVLDEPTSGLHVKDTERLMDILHSLVDRGNSVIVIEHNLQVIAQADWIIDLGPQGGKHGGEVVAEGTTEDLCRNENSLTGRYLHEYLEKFSPLVV